MWWFTLNFKLSYYHTEIVLINILIFLTSSKRSFVEGINSDQNGILTFNA